MLVLPCAFAGRKVRLELRSDEFQQVAEVVDDPGCVSEGFAGAVAVGYAAGAGAGVAAHMDVKDCVADYDGLFWFETKFL